MKSWLRLQTWILVYMCSLSWSKQTDHYPTVGVLWQWKLPEFDYPTEQARYDAIQRGDFIPKNVVLFATDYYAPTGRYFISSPYIRSGVPATLSEVTKDREILKPFPRWPDRRSCHDPFSVYRFHIDKCGLMWVIDSGKSPTLESNTLVCPPKLLAYDLNDHDREILRYEFPTGLFTDRSLLASIITESYESDCSDSIVYITDPSDPALIVFDFRERKSWRIVNKLFYPYPTEGTITTNNVTLDLMDGVVGIALSPPTDYDRKLYFSGFSSFRQSWAPVTFLKNQTLVRDVEVARKVFAVSPGQRESQSWVQVMTDDGILIYALLARNAIACWNSKTPFTIENQHILLENNEDLQFVTGMTLKNNKLLITSNRLQKFIFQTMDETVFNYKVVVVEDVKRLLQNTLCYSGLPREEEYYYVRPHITQPWLNTFRDNLYYKKYYSTDV